MLEKRPNPFEGAQIKCGSQTFLQNDIKLKLPWRPQDIRDARAVGYLLRKAANREWKQPKRFVLQSTRIKEVGDLMSALPSNMEFGV